MSRPRKYPEELLERGVRLALESGRPIAHVASDLGIHSETLRKRVRQVEADEGLRPDLPTSEEREEIKRLRQENFELRRAHETLPPARPCGARLQSGRPEPALGGRPLLSALLGGLGLLRLRPRRVQPDDRRLATREPHAHRPRPRRLADGTRATRTGRRRRVDTSQ